MLTLIFGIWASEPPPAWRTTEKAGPDRVKVPYRNGFKIGTNLKVNLDSENDKPAVKSKEVEMVKTEPDVKPMVKTKPNVEPNKEHKQGVKPDIEFDKEHKPITDSNREHKYNLELDKEHKQDLRNLILIRSPVRKKRFALVLGITSVFTVWWMFK